MPLHRLARWLTGSRQRIAEGVAVAAIIALAAFVIGILPGRVGSDSASTDVAPAPVPTSSAECLLKMTGELTGIDADIPFERLSTGTRDLSELWQANPAIAQSESLAFIDELRFQSWKMRELTILVAERDIEFAGEIFDTAMAAADAADLLYFDSANHGGIIIALAIVSAAAADLARKIDYGC